MLLNRFFLCTLKSEKNNCLFLNLLFFYMFAKFYRGRDSSLRDSVMNFEKDNGMYLQKFYLAAFLLMRSCEKFFCYKYYFYFKYILYIYFQRVDLSFIFFFYFQFKGFKIHNKMIAVDTWNKLRANKQHKTNYDYNIANRCTNDYTFVRA